MRKMVLVNVAIDVKDNLCGPKCRFKEGADAWCHLFGSKLRIDKDDNIRRNKKCVAVEPEQ